MNKILSASLMIIMGLTSQLSLAQTNSLSMLKENTRWSIDFSSRATRNLEIDRTSFTNVVGLDVHKVFSSSTSDIGTLIFQPYLVKLNNESNPNLTFDHANDAKVIWRMVNFNYTALSQGKLNIRIGHFEVPYGLEYLVDTNGTLRQLTFTDRGIKGDWGVSINGIMPKFEYEVALTRGTNQDITSSDNPYIFSGRLGTLSNKNFVTGLSWFTGDVLGNNGLTNIKKLGIDASYYYYQWEFIAESSIGKTAQNDTVNTFVEALWKTPNEEFVAYLQLGYQQTEVASLESNRVDSSSYWVVGVQWLNSQGIDLSAQYKNKLNDASTVEVAPTLSIQLRYRI
ncbi:hypothetical protein [Paraglaciecola sp. 2405UD69-4]|uniref:hypothetical protein n=1 Tax=Paraglaciecola sp. 2405UD69-4 TaxID=3391836 RepID=UPI0039C9B5C9